ncbi:hypothetical protein EDC04DRAFT_2973525 [Pisolithus marmoratus]|nr:hypothetical protein EDC04DRAFT_2973525 [Pisolithus marmoratus]
MSDVPALRHPVYYFPQGTHIFCVDNTLYKLHQDVLISHSLTFKEMFQHGASPYPEGKSDEHAIPLQDRRATFDLFLDHIYGHSRSVGSADAYSHAELQDLLKLVQKYCCAKTRRFAIDHIWEKRFTYHPAELLNLGLHFHIPKVFSRGFKGLLEIPLKEISKEHHHLIGEKVFVAFVYAKAMLDEHCKIVACEEPVILSHTSDCENPTACQEDWHTVWWNGMGWFLLDGRNPQPFSEAVKRFREMQFG